MKITKALYLQFAGNSASTQITVPFQVARIHVKGIAYNPQNNPVAGSAQYGVIQTDLTDNQPIGIFYNDATYSFSSFKDIDLTLYTPKTINGTYTFNLVNDVGNPYTPVGAGVDSVIIILEFNDINEIK